MARVTVFTNGPITVTTFDDMAPVPRATILIEASGISPSASSVDVLQISDGIERVVRDASKISAVGGVFVTDYEIPVGVSVTYQAREFDSVGVPIGLTASVAVLLDGDGSLVVLQDMLAPATAVRVHANGSFASQLPRSRPSRIYETGRTTIALTGQLSLVRGAPLSVMTETDEEARALLALLERTPLLIRSRAGATRLPPLFYCDVSSIVEAPVDVQWGGSLIRWELSADEVSRTLLATIEAAVTWQRYIDAYPTWQDMIDAYPTWFDAISNPPPEA